MKKYNLSPDTLVSPGEDVLPESVNLVPEVGHRFRKDPAGFYKIGLQSLIEERARVRRKLSHVAVECTTARVLRERERALKVITNACYGYAGWPGARWYVREVAESAAAFGRQTITKTIDHAKTLGLGVIYSDTDSIFVSNIKQRVDKLKEWVKQELGLEIRIEREYVRVLFTEAMKRYAGLRKDNSIDNVGLEIVRSDWSEVAREVQDKVLQSILKDRSTEMAILKVRETVQRLRDGKLPIEAFIIRKALTKPIEKYRVRTTQAEVARRLVEDGWDIGVGDKVAYVIVKGKGALFQKARPYRQVKRDDLDLEYYVENQVKPATMRILEGLGVTERQLGV
jgi:DNA polymerase I